MFDLNEAIAEWRRQMRAAGIRTPMPLDELESHLRDDLDRLIQSGSSPAQAFEAAVQRMGQSRMLKAEFEKIGGLREARHGKVIGIACCTFAGLFSLLLAPRFLTIHELSTAQRMWGLTAVALTVLSIASWGFSHKYLPVIRNRRVRIAVGVGCGLTGAICLLAFGNLLPNVIVPRLFQGDASADSVRGSVLIGLNGIPSGGHEPVFMIAISILWAIALMAVLGSIAYGLEEAARRRITNADS